MRWIIILIILPTYCIAQDVTHLILVDANSNQDIAMIADSMVVDISLTGPSLNIRAEVGSGVSSVVFGLNSNNVYRTENVAPYALEGDSNGNYNSWSPPVGFYTITATAYSGSDGTGTTGSFVTKVIQIVDGEISDPIYPNDSGTGEVQLSGELKKWHKVTLSFDGPSYKESSTSANPFLDLRLNVTFTNGQKKYSVPGYFAADGNAAETSVDSGNIWRVHFAPDTVGDWTYDVSFRFGSNIAVSDIEDAGQPVPPLDGKTGLITIGPSDKTAPDLRSLGRLQYVGDRYLKFVDSNQYFLKGGADAPENLLAYDDFDNTPDYGGRRKSYGPHAGDWNPGDPTWQNGKGTELIGAINYLASKGINVFSFLTMNIGGDDKNVFPYIHDQNFERMDCSKLDQWEIIFEHASTLGFYLHFKTQETENDHLLDGGAVGVQRKLYYRELIARFGHHLALNWNMGEENTQTESQRKEMAQYFADHDPYQHNRVIHTYPGQIAQVYTPLLGSASAFTGVSIQTTWSNVHNQTKIWVDNSLNSGKNWVVANDEQGSANLGVPPDPGYPGYNGSSPDLNDIRKQVLWGNLMAGGAGVEYYFGYQQPESDLSLQDFRSRDLTWNYVRFALQFFNTLPVHEMYPDDDLVSNGWCLAKGSELYILYLPSGGSTNLFLDKDSTYQIQWYNPRNGNYEEPVPLVGNALNTTIGPPPFDPTEDWAIILSKISAPTTNSDIEVGEDYISIYPNPVENKFIVSGNLQQFNIQILNGAGQIIETIQETSSEEISMESLPTGIYFISIQHKTTGKLSLHKILKD